VPEALNGRELGYLAFAEGKIIEQKIPSIDFMPINAP